NLTFLVVFFSSRRRHTRFSRDWSSDVCSSDLARLTNQREDHHRQYTAGDDERAGNPADAAIVNPGHGHEDHRGRSARPHEEVHRSEERRVGKEGRTQRWRKGKQITKERRTKI